MAKELSVPSAPKLGKYLTHIGPGEDTSTFGKVCMYGPLIIGLGSFAMPVVITPKPGEEVGIWALFGVLGMLLVGVSIFLFLLATVFASKDEVYLFEKGIVLRNRNETEIIPWEHIAHVRLLTIWEDRFSSYIDVKLSRRNAKAIQFSSQLTGNAEPIIKAIEQSSPVVERDEMIIG